MTSYKIPNSLDEIKTLKNEIYSLTGKLNDIISVQLVMHEVDSKKINSSCKLVDSFIKLVHTEEALSSKYVEDDDIKDITEEDRIILQIYESEMMAPRAGLEPATERLTAACSTTELPRNYQEVSYKI